MWGLRPLGRLHAVSKFRELSAALLKAIHHKVARLVAVLVAHLGLLGQGVERLEPGAALLHVLELAKAREDPGAKGADVVALPHDAKLDSVPVDLGQVPDLLLRGAKGREADAVDELRVGGVRQHHDVAEELVDDVRLGGVHGLGVVPHVLRAVEGLEREAREEVSGVQEPGDRPDPPAGPLLDQRRHVLELRDNVLPEVEQLPVLVELGAGVGGVQGHEVPQGSAPRLDLVRGVLHAGDRLPDLVGVSQLHDLHAALLVVRVQEAGVLLAELCAKAEDPPVVDFVDALGDFHLGRGGGSGCRRARSALSCGEGGAWHSDVSQGGQLLQSDCQTCRECTRSALRGGGGGGGALRREGSLGASSTSGHQCRNHVFVLAA